MCNPIASKIQERSKIMQVSAQQNEELAGHADENRNADANSTTSEDVPPPTNVSSATVGSASADPNPIEGDENMEDTATSEGSSKATTTTRKKHEMDTIREYDVLMGRGSGPNRHSGNIHFRAIVGEVFDEFLSKHGHSDRSLMGDGGSDMLRIDPSTKNRLAQAVLDKITLEKKGRFLQKMNKKELMEAIEKGEDGDLIKARAVSLMDTAMATAVPTDPDAVKAAADGKSGDSNGKTVVHAVVYYKIIPEKQILAKIKQTFRFLRDQNEASNAEKHRQRTRRIAAASCGLPVDQQSLSVNPLGAMGGLPLAGGLSNPSTIAAYALMERMGNNPLGAHAALGVNPAPLPDKLGLSNPRSLGNLMPSASSMAMSAIKAPGSATNYQSVASRLLCDLPQPNRILSTSDPTPSQMFQGNPLAAAMNQLEGNTNKIASPVDTSAKRLLEELTLSRLANLQKQREDTINAYLAMERTTGVGASVSAGIGGAASAIDGVGLTQSATNPAAQQLQRLLNLNAGTPGPMPMAPASATASAALGGLTPSTSEPLSLLLQLNNSKNGLSPATGNHHLRSFSTNTL